MPWEDKDIPNDISLVKKPDFKREEMINAFQQCAKIIHNRPKNIVVELNAFRKYVPIILKAYLTMDEGLKKAVKQVGRISSIDYDRSNKRWSKDEDEELIDRVCREDENIHELSTIFGRSPGAIKTHISELVGRKRLSMSVAGRFIGTIDGNETDAEITGTVYKRG